MAKVIIPKTYVTQIDTPLIFLAGPIRSAPNWQDEAIKFLFSQNQNITIASPRRGIREEITQYVAEGNESYFSRQRAWERHYLDIASKAGAILFWLPGEEQHDCNKVYGAMTRLEIGQWMTNYKHDNSIRFCVGSDGKFPELGTISYDLQLDAPDKRVYENLEETCLEALKLI
ncbi:MAG: nucleoside 2-deoxyribosyltransferase domain-containing protein [Nanoarchaeota archaeon]|nr:nucleoside 2-deoxyribosyltransferase domain-containing protein [Nanoarchaeota archaeon]